MLSRRSFFKISGTSLIAVLAMGSKHRRVLAAPIPGGTLDPLSIPKYQTPLLIPPVMPLAGTIKLKGGKNADYYEISVKQFQEQILPSGFPATTVWGYGAVKSADPRGLLLHHAPSLTIEATVNKPVCVKWINDLVDENGDYLPHLLAVDPTLHWANPPGGTTGSDTRPDFTGKTYVPLDQFTDPATQYTQYTGPVPMVPHVHGAVGVGDDSDGYAEAWWLPAANDIPAGYATKGRWYNFFESKASSSYGVTWGAGYATFVYPNKNRASTVWYHDHSVGMTRLNVYAGPAGFFLLRGGSSGDKAVLDSRSGLSAVLPGPAPKAGDKFPPNKTYYEIPIAIQDRAFNVDGSLFYPNTREFFDGATGDYPGYVPESDIAPIWNPEFFGNTIMVNGNTWPFQTVEQRRYRMRFLNGCQSRFLILDFNAIPGIEVWQIGNEGGFLAAPVNLTASNGNRLLMTLAERADLIVDFTHVPLGTHILTNVGPDEPYGGGEPGVDFTAADVDTTGQIMAFNVVPAVVSDPTTPPQFLVLPAITPLPAPIRTRQLALLEMEPPYWSGPSEAMLGIVDPNGVPMHKMWMEPVTENPGVGDTEVWEIFNTTADAHPMHIHETVFEVINREGMLLDPVSGAVSPAGNPRSPEAWETGFKDTVISYPGEITRVRLKFDNPGQFVWHCHIVEHEDNEMMRPYRIGPVQPGQP